MKEITITFFDDMLLAATVNLLHEALGIDIPINNGGIDGDALAEELKRTLAAGAA